MAKKLEATKKVVPSQVGFWDTAIGKTAKAAAYLAVSAAIAGVIARIADEPMLFGGLTPIVNVVLVALKGLVDPNVKNY